MALLTTPIQLPNTQNFAADVMRVRAQLAEEQQKQQVEQRLAQAQIEAGIQGNLQAQRRDFEFKEQMKYNVAHMASVDARAAEHNALERQIYQRNISPFGGTPDVSGGGTQPLSPQSGGSSPAASVPPLPSGGAGSGDDFPMVDDAGALQPAASAPAVDAGWMGNTMGGVASYAGSVPTVQSPVAAPIKQPDGTMSVSPAVRAPSLPLPVADSSSPIIPGRSPSTAAAAPRASTMDSVVQDAVNSVARARTPDGKPLSFQEGSAILRAALPSLMRPAAPGRAGAPPVESDLTPKGNGVFEDSNGATFYKKGIDRMGHPIYERTEEDLKAVSQKTDSKGQIHYTNRFGKEVAVSDPDTSFLKPSVMPLFGSDGNIYGMDRSTGDYAGKRPPQGVTFGPGAQKVVMKVGSDGVEYPYDFRGNPMKPIPEGVRFDKHNDDEVSYRKFDETKKQMVGFNWKDEVVATTDGDFSKMAASMNSARNLENQIKENGYHRVNKPGYENVVTNADGSALLLAEQVGGHTNFKPFKSRELIRDRDDGSIVRIHDGVVTMILPGDNIPKAEKPAFRKALTAEADLQDKWTREEFQIKSGNKKYDTKSQELYDSMLSARKEVEVFRQRYAAPPTPAVATPPPAPTPAVPVAQAAAAPAAAASYATKEDVRAAVAAGKLTPAQGVEIVRAQFGLK